MAITKCCIHPLHNAIKDVETSLKMATLKGAIKTDESYLIIFKPMNGVKWVLKTS